MDFDLSPKVAQKIFQGEGGSYYSWSASQYPILQEATVSGGKLVLEPLGLALPHYADSSKVGYVIQGSGRVGMVLSNSSDEKVLRLKKGDVIPVPLGAVSWWFNDGESALVVVFLGETSKAYHSGDFTYFLLAGANGIFKGFSMEFIRRALGLNEKEANELVNSQTGVLIVKLKEGKRMPEPCMASTKEMIFNTDAATPDVDIFKGGRAVVVTVEKLPLLQQVGLSSTYIKLDSNALHSPGYSLDSAFEVIYIVKGGGHVQIVGINGQCILDTHVSTGQLFVVPKFFAVSKIAGSEGMEWFSMITTTRPAFSYLTGKRSVWKALSSEVKQATLNGSPELEKVITSNMSKIAIFVPPSN